ncbi:hypothetical protein GCM10010123_01720 [Pilimelia anulata]|uniref:Uncharacterized protein n=1 Tax=Pilimelia anulata TaxID=53371 RepID=A0A8J3FAK5_9ACTN|nr:hypothetical protein GCM10010123_01720 [Pilimelia anulata]
MSERLRRPHLTLINGGGLLPLRESADVFPMAHTPGVRLPFAARLARPMPATVRHATTPTPPGTSTGTSRSNDGKAYPGTTRVTDSDS